MGSGKKEIKSALSAIEGTIYDLEKRIAQLKEMGDPVTGVMPEGVKQEMAVLTQQLDAARATKQIVEEKLQKIKKEDERKELEKILKYVMLVGAINENIRQRENRERYYTPQKESSTVFDFEAAVSDLFQSEDFRYVTRMDAEAILADKEFQRMAAEDPNRLTRDEQDMKSEYGHMMEKVLGLATGVFSDDFYENEKRFQDFLKKNNGFEEVLKRETPFMKEDLPALGTEKDIAFFAEVMKEIEALAEETRRLQEEFLIGSSSFDKGNGYTKELVDRERALVKRIDEYADNMMNGEGGIITMDSNDPKTNNALRVYEQLQYMLTPVRQQSERDVVLYRANVLRERMERWKVYKHLSRGTDQEVQYVSEEEENRQRALAKLQRMQRDVLRKNMAPDEELSDTQLKERKMAIAEGRAGIEVETCAWAADDVQTLLERLDQGGKAMNRIAAEKLASLVLHQMIMYEMKRKPDEERPYYDELKKGINSRAFREMAVELANTKEFKAAMKTVLGGKNLTEGCIRFLAYDGEKKVARELAGMKKKLTPAAAPKATPKKEC